MFDEDYMLTTHDNPINPFSQFEAWFKLDHILGHNCCETLAKEACLSDVASDAVNEKDTNDAIDRIVSRWPFIYKKVKQSDFKS